jgi:hypothetical protein
VQKRRTKLGRIARSLSLYICINMNPTPHGGTRGSTVGIATGYGMDDRGVVVRVPVGSRMLSSPRRQTGFGVHPTSYSIGTGGSFPGG